MGDYDQIETARAARAEEVRPTQVTPELNMLRETVLMVRDHVAALEDRLGGVLRNEPEPSDTVAGPEEVLVPVADDLRSIRRIAEGCDAQLTSILRRLEL